MHMQGATAVDGSVATRADSLKKSDAAANRAKWRPSAETTPGIRILCVAVFLLAAAPRFRYVLAGIPIYFIDVFAAISFVYAMRYPMWRQGTPSIIYRCLIVFLFGLVIGQLNGMVFYPAFMQSLYMLLRYACVVSFVYSVPQLVNNSRDFDLLIKSAVGGLLATAAVAVLVSLPGTRGTISSVILSNPMLEPAAVRTTEKLQIRQVGTGTRGISLVGTSTLTGAFLSILWPIAFILTLPQFSDTRWRQAATVACVIAPIGAVMTYSRSAVVG
jgi:hypothetical protein